MTKNLHMSFGGRFFLSWKMREAADGEVWTLERIGQAVAQAEGRKKPYTKEAVRGWRDGTEPDWPVVRAIARVFGVDPRWLSPDIAESETSPPPPKGMSTFEQIEAVVARLAAKDAARRKRGA